MRPIIYRNTRTNLPNWSDSNTHEKLSHGIAFECKRHFVHFYCLGEPDWTLQQGLTVTEAKTGSLKKWVQDAFGAEDIIEGSNDVGCAISRVWRPGQFMNAQRGYFFPGDSVKMHRALVTLQGFLETLEEIFRFIDPNRKSLGVFGHRTRELLILSSTEVENIWRSYLSCVGQEERRFTTKDYVKLLKPLHLDDFHFTLRGVEGLPDFVPFSGWQVEKPTQSLDWYSAYNATKHNKDQHFDKATLDAAIKSVCAYCAVLAAAHGPYSLSEGMGAGQLLFNRVLQIRTVDPERSSFYCPRVTLPELQVSHRVVFDSHSLTEPWDFLDFPKL